MLQFILKEATEPLIMISYAELHRERTFPFFLTRNLISGKKAIRQRKCYLPEWFHFCWSPTPATRHHFIHKHTHTLI
jgi:hypothetical protein